MNRRAFVKSGGLALTGSILAVNRLLQPARGAVSVAAAGAPVELCQVFNAAYHEYLSRPDAYRDLYRTYLAVAPKFIPECDETAWAKEPAGPLAAALKKGVLRFGYAETPPYVYHAENGELAGMNWELGNALTSLIRTHYAGYAEGKGLRAEWVKITVPSAEDPEAARFNALCDGLKQNMYDIAMSGQANVSTATSIPSVKDVDWSCPTELLFTNVLYTGRDNLNARLAKITGGTREQFIAEIQSWTTDAIFMCVVNEGPSKTNTEALVKAIGSRAKLRLGNVQEINEAISTQAIHFSVGDAVTYAWKAVQPGFKGLNLNIAAATDPLGTAQAVAAFMLR